MPPTLLVPGSIKGVDDKPINYIINWIKQHMYEYGNTQSNMNDRVLIVYAETGSGKSTVMPVEMFRILRNINTPSNVVYRGKKVICTQPKVLTAIELARTVSNINSAYNPDMILGKIVGYITRPKKERARGLIYATTGVLRAKLNMNTDEELMNEYKIIIIDEAHERSIDSDVLLFMLYKFYKRNEGNKNLPFLILTSATFNTTKYANYFEISLNNIIKVSGSFYNIQNIYLEHDSTNIYDSIITKIKDINANIDEPNKADVLIFAPGMKEMKEIEKRIRRDIKEYVLVVKLDSEAVNKQTDDYINIFISHNKLPKINGKLPIRRIIVSTSVAETGLTINTLKYVIDMGYHRSVESYPIYNTKGLITRPAAQSRIIQRRGRCGRLFDGEFYPMYTKDTYDHLDAQQLPDIITSSKEYNNVHLSLYRLLDNNFKIENLKLLDKPSQESFLGANIIATTLGFIDDECKLTELGMIASKFTYISMEAAKLIFSGFAYNVAITDLITIAAIMQTTNGTIFLNDFMYKKYMDTHHYEIDNAVPCSAHVMESILPDFITNIVGGGKNIQDDKNHIYFYKYKILICDDFIESLLAFNAFVKQIQAYKDNSNIIEWCQRKCLNIAGLTNVYELRESILDELLSTGIDVMYNNQYTLSDQSIDTFMTTIINIKQCLYESLRHNLIQYDDESKKYKTMTGLEIEIENSILSTQFQNQLKSMNVISETLQPKYILTDHIKMSIKGDGTIIYVLSANYISILDGYVYHDDTFGGPIYADIKKLQYNEIDSDPLFKLKSYHRLIKTMNDNIQLPACHLNSNVSKLFGKHITSNIIDTMCKK